MSQKYVGDFLWNCTQRCFKETTLFRQFLIRFLRSCLMQIKGWLVLISRKIISEAFQNPGQFTQRKPEYNLSNKLASLENSWAPLYMLQSVCINLPGLRENVSRETCPEKRVQIGGIMFINQSNCHVCLLVFFCCPCHWSTTHWVQCSVSERKASLNSWVSHRVWS